MDVPVRKLRYDSKSAALLDLIIKSVIDINYKKINGTQAVVECGLIVLIDGINTEDGEIIKLPIYVDGYHYDVMTTDDIFFENEVFPKNEKYKFFNEKTL
jgi:hypothetical protein